MKAAHADVGGAPWQEIRVAHRLRSEGAAWRAAHGFPKDGYFASGNLGQRIYIVPSERLVVARFGYTTGRNFGIEADVNLIAAAISALR